MRAPAGSGEDEPRGGAWSSRGNPLTWSDVDKCLLVVGVMMPGVILFVLLERFAHGWLYLPGPLEPELRGPVFTLALTALAVWTLVLGAGALLRRRRPSSRLLVYLTVQLYSLNIAGFVCLAGAFHSPGWILFIGGAIVGFLLFGRLATFLGIATFIAVFAAWLIAGHAGALGDLVRATRPPAADDSEWVWWVVRMSASTLVFGVATLALCVYVIAMLRDREARLEVMSKTDVLTGVHNRRHFMQLLGREFARARRYQSPLSCVMIDLDHFKQINDRHGHLTGDHVLAAVASAIVRAVRDSDIVARYGGEEFCLLLPNTDLVGARELAERCRELIARTQVADRAGLLSVTASMGISSYPGAAISSVDALLGAADDALYRAKAGGRDRVVTADEGAASGAPPADAPVHQQ
jgi:diguanylate cyclase (GGDEF)-like protein